MIDKLLQKISKNNKIDFMIYLGNDSGDEAVYELLKSKKVNEEYFHQKCERYICISEKKPTEADYYIEDLDSVRSLLEKFWTNTQKRKKIRSYSDLTKLVGDQNQL